MPQLIRTVDHSRVEGDVPQPECDDVTQQDGRLVCGGARAGVRGAASGAVGAGAAGAHLRVRARAQKDNIAQLQYSTYNVIDVFFRKEWRWRCMCACAGGSAG